jgi:hypothetical protein
MSADATTPFADQPLAVPAPGSRMDVAFEWLGERLNPILIKETRQALKSRQFVLTFGLLLIAAWGWSLIGLVMMEVDGGYGQAGPGMFIGYYCILAAAIGVFVPFGAFRSLASEQEERTYELLSITGLSPRQIVSGKLGSAVVQVAIYMSAIAPCLAFTYMLRGISMPMILFVVVYTVLGALGLSVIGLLIGTLTGEKHWQVLLSVVLIVGLLIVFGFAIGITSGLVFEGDYLFGNREFWMVMGMLLTAYLTYFALVFYAAVAQITFVSDNRSTKLRIIMLIQHACLIGWFGGVFLGMDNVQEEVFYGLVTVAAFHWGIMGSLMIGEWPELSMRVKRGLPQSFLGRSFLTWFNPGPGSGFMFACCGLIAASVSACFILLAGMAFGSGGSITSGDMQSVVAFSTLVPAYVIAYMGISLILVRFLRRFTQATLFVATLIEILLISGGTAGPFVLESIIDSGTFGGYSLIQITNPFWSSMHIVDRNTLPVETPVLLTVVPLAALIAFLCNLPAILHEVRHVRIAKPARVAEEDEQLAAEIAPHEPVQVSPWDVE